TVDVQVGNGPIHHAPKALFDTGGEYGAIPAPYLGKNDTDTIMNSNVPIPTVRDGTPITVYDPNNHKELYSFTVTHNHKPQIVQEGEPFVSGLPPFLEHEIYIGNEDPNSGSPGSFGDFAPNVGTTTIDR
ncbi:MAG: hypothetical protein J2P17_10890, partial [Mycobacterium sp.]|nr:hypothetical protein [Mycobacterium sp.]